MFLRSLSLALAMGVAAAAAPAAAKNEVRVSIADLNLATEAGQKTLDRRLTRAARTVCGGRPNIIDYTGMKRYRECMASTKELYAPQRTVAISRALENANAKRVAVLADKLGFLSLR